MLDAMRYLGVGETAPESLRRDMAKTAALLAASLQPRFVYRYFDLELESDGFRVAGTDLLLRGRTVETMLAQCRRCVLLACTLGAEFDAMLRREQIRDMSRAVMLDACGSAWVESGCDAAEAEVRAALPEGLYLTDRFSPGYGDLPLEHQHAICALLDTERRIGLHVTNSCLLNPMKSVTAIIGIADQPQMARIRGCGFCSMRKTCQLRKGGTHCEL